MPEPFKAPFRNIGGDPKTRQVALCCVLSCSHFPGTAPPVPPCSKQYVRDLDPSDSRTYIIQGDYLLPFDIPELKPYLGTAVHDAGGMSLALAATLAHLASQGAGVPPRRAM
jgi:hypothetical protein